MGGYKEIYNQLFGVPKGLHSYYLNDLLYCHVGTVAGIQQVVCDTSGKVLTVADRTPPNFVGNASVGFTFDTIFDTTTGLVQLVAHVAPDAQDAASSQQTVPVIGDITSISRLALFSDPGSGALDGGTWTQPDLAGGIACIQPFVFGFGTGGLLQWSAANLPLTLGIVGGSSGAGQAHISGQKVLGAMPLRGGGIQAPCAIIWTVSEVIVATFVGSPAWFAFNTVSPSSSVLSTSGFVEYDGLYFWPGVDRFLTFNGIVSEVPNPQNQDWFFNNLTPGYEASTFGFKIPRYGEIWWCACMFGSTVPNYAIIFNVRENTWYDTALPNGLRGAGYHAQGFRYPLLAGAGASSGTYSLWLHEYGQDQVAINGSLTAIRSYFETPYFGGPKDNPPDDRGLQFAQLEPDLQPTGDLSIYLLGSANARAPESQGPTMRLPMVPSSPQEQFLSFLPTQSQRLSRLHIESNVIGGNYLGGRNLGHGQPADARMFS